MPAEKSPWPSGVMNQWRPSISSTRKRPVASLSISRAPPKRSSAVKASAEGSKGKASF